MSYICMSKSLRWLFGARSTSDPFLNLFICIKFSKSGREYREICLRKRRTNCFLIVEGAHVNTQHRWFPSSGYFWFRAVAAVALGRLQRRRRRRSAGCRCSCSDPLPPPQTENPSSPPQLENWRFSCFYSSVWWRGNFCLANSGSQIDVMRIKAPERKWSRN